MSVQFLQVLDFFDKTIAHVRSQIEIECRDRLTTMHFVLGCFERDTA